jgi:hypothetical protein
MARLERGTDSRLFDRTLKLRGAGVRHQGQNEGQRGDWPLEKRLPNGSRFHGFESYARDSV